MQSELVQIVGESWLVTPGLSAVVRGRPVVLLLALLLWC